MIASLSLRVTDGLLRRVLTRETQAAEELAGVAEAATQAAWVVLGQAQAKVRMRSAVVQLGGRALETTH
jgi:hypothetical protein